MSFTMCSQPIGQEPGVNGCVAWEKLEGVEGGQGGRGCLARSALGQANCQLEMAPGAGNW